MRCCEMHDYPGISHHHFIVITSYRDKRSLEVLSRCFCRLCTDTISRNAGDDSQAGSEVGRREGKGKQRSFLGQQLKREHDSEREGHKG